MTPREHAQLARRLIDACGGLAEAAGACRVGKSLLSDYQSPHVATFMPADVIADLEAYCGEAIYSEALFSRVGKLAQPAADLRASTCELTELAATVQSKTRLALTDEALSPREIDDLTASLGALNEAAERVRATLEAAEKLTRPNLKAV